jgi:uncharacterized membrane protein YkgB
METTMTAIRLPSWAYQYDAMLIRLARRYGITLLRVSVGVVFVWFGALKLVPGLSPAEPLIRATLPFLPMGLFLPFLAIWEMTIGIGFIIGRWPRITMALMLLQMGGAMSPLFLRPDVIFNVFPFVWTLEGQYVFKDIILIAAGIVISAATVVRQPGSGEDKRLLTSELSLVSNN